MIILYCAADRHHLRHVIVNAMIDSQAYPMRAPLQIWLNYFTVPVVFCDTLCDLALRFLSNIEQLPLIEMGIRLAKTGENHDDRGPLIVQLERISNIIPTRLW